MRALTLPLSQRVLATALPLAIVTYAALALAIAPHVFPDMVQSYIGQTTVLPFILAVGLLVAGVIRRPRSPFSFAFEVLRDGGGRLLIVVGFFCVGLAAFTTFKLTIPKVVPFYADPFLADIDAWLHNGNPGEKAHALVPSWAQYPLGYLYGPVWFFLWFGLMVFVALQKSFYFRLQYFWAMALSLCLLGTVVATALSSVGPVFYGNFYDPGRFQDLLNALKASAVGEPISQASAFLLTNYQTGGNEMGTGISAMPSMHLAIVTLNACMLTRCNRFVGAIAWIYVGLILLGSVYFAWHYALDGYFSIIAVSAIWWFVGRLVSPGCEISR